MKTPLARLLALLLSTLPLAAVNVGDKLDSVLAEKGVPASRLERGATILLTYPDATIRLKDGAVVSGTTTVTAGTLAVTGTALADGARLTLDGGTVNLTVWYSVV